MRARAVTGPKDSDTLGQAKQWLRKRVDKGERCPCCTQRAKVYKRQITDKMTYLLIMLARLSAPGEWIYTPELLSEVVDGTGVWPDVAKWALRGGDWGKLTSWKLLDRGRNGEDGGVVCIDESRALYHAKGSGWWRVTELGREFIAGHATVPKYARVYDTRTISVEGEQVSVRDTLGARFSYEELMGR